MPPPYILVGYPSSPSLLHWCFLVSTLLPLSSIHPSNILMKMFYTCLWWSELWSMIFNGLLNLEVCVVYAWEGHRQNLGDSMPCSTLRICLCVHFWSFVECWSWCACEHPHRLSLIRTKTIGSKTLNKVHCYYDWCINQNTSIIIYFCVQLLISPFNLLWCIVFG